MALFRRDAVRRAAGREHAADGRAASWLRVELYGAAMQLDERAYDRQPEADAAVAGSERVALEAVEHPRDDLRRDAAALVGHLEHDLLVGLPGPQRHRLARGREADRVGEKIEQDL